MIETLTIPSPKRNKRLQSGWEGFFPYYAGFPEAFARTVLTSAGLSQDAVVLDPWNGSGTTTHAASILGLRSIGFDLNPVMAVIARARLLSPSEADSIIPLGCAILQRANRSDRTVLQNDPLLTWFCINTATTIRSIEKSIRSHLLGPKALTPDGLHFERMSGLAATAYSALFSVCRDLTVSFQSSNPTWLRIPKDDTYKISHSKSIIATAYMQKMAKISDTLAEGADLFSKEQALADIRMVDTTDKWDITKKIDFVLTSPPYCTRIDYTAATRVELAVIAPLLDLEPGEISMKMLGSVKVPKKIAPVSEVWGDRCATLLQNIKSHPSKASSGYYYKTHIDYFDKVSRSIHNMSGSMKCGGVAVVVVQDSYYKDVYNDLPGIYVEMASIAGLSLQRRDNFVLKHTMSDINPKAKLYARQAGGMEAVLCFQKQQCRE